MSIDWEDLRVLRAAQKPKPEPCSKDAGYIQATATDAAVDAVCAVYNRSMGKPVVNGDLEPVVMCSWCNRIKEDGKWVEAEVFECEITHTICPDCFEKERRDVFKEESPIHDYPRVEPDEEE